MRFFLTIVVILVSAAAGWSQCFFPAMETPLPKMVRRTIVAYGSVEFPIDFKLVDRGGSVDWWYGTLLSEDEKFRIAFSAGTVESIFEKYKRDFICTEEVKGDEFPVAFAVVKKSHKEIVLAKVFWAQFQATVTNEKEKALFFHIVRSYRKK